MANSPLLYRLYSGFFHWCIEWTVRRFCQSDRCHRTCFEIMERSSNLTNGTIEPQVSMGNYIFKMSTLPTPLDQMLWYFKILHFWLSWSSCCIGRTSGGKIYRCCIDSRFYDPQSGRIFIDERYHNMARSLKSKLVSSHRTHLVCNHDF